MLNIISDARMETPPWHEDRVTNYGLRQLWPVLVSSVCIVTVKHCWSPYGTHLPSV